MIWCLGMYASGSTWLYNAVRQVALAQERERVVGTYAETMEVLRRLPAGALNIVKTHDLPVAEANFMAARAARILVSIRDPRDAVVSLMQHMRHRFGAAVERVERSALFCERFAGDPRVEIFSLEAGFTEDIATLDRLAAILGGTLGEDARARLFTETRRAAIEAKIAQIEQLPRVARDARSGDVVDLDTQWHRHHAGRTGEIGRWERLLPAEAARLIELRMGGWMRRFGYLPPVVV